MDVLMLSRLQFALATFFHFLFVPLTLGLSLILAILETKYFRSGNEVYKRATKFWGKIFLVNFVLGVVTGITLEFQFGTNWSRYSVYVGDIFGSLLAIEATAAFFLESTFVAVWAFGWNRVSKGVHLASIWIVAGASNFSAIWILLANGFMQNPVGYHMPHGPGGRVELADFMAVLGNEFAWGQILHTLFGAFLLAGFFVMGVSAYHILRKKNLDLFLKSFRLGLIFAFTFSILVALQGHYHATIVSRLQPAKLAAMESHWDTVAGAPIYILTFPDEKNEKNYIEAIKIPKLLSFMAFADPEATVKGLKDFPPEDRPPVALTFMSFRIMVGLGVLFILVAVLGFLWRKDIASKPLYLKCLPYLIPLPYLCLEFGWTVAEVGRQPWIVYGLMRTKDAVSPIDVEQVAFTIIFMAILYAFLTVVNIFLMFKIARKGPEEAGPNELDGGLENKIEDSKATV